MDRFLRSKNRSLFSRSFLLGILFLGSFPWSRSEALSDACKRRLRRIAAVSILGSGSLGLGYTVFEKSQTDPISTVRSENRSGRHFALVGDSISTDFFYTAPLTSIPREVFRLRTTRSGGYFLDRTRDETGSLFDLCQGIGQADCYAAVGAWIDAESGKQNGSSPLLHTVGGITDVSKQIQQVLDQDSLPEVLLVAGGHNDADIVYIHRQTGRPLDELVHTVPVQMEKDLERQLRRVAEAAIEHGHTMHIGVMALIDFDKAIEVRREVLRLHQQGLYPDLSAAIEGYPTLMPEYQELGKRMSVDVLQRWERLVQQLDAEYAAQGIHFRLLRALHDLSLQPSDVSPRDGLHLSPSGHGRVADRLQAELRDWIER